MRTKIIAVIVGVGLLFVMWMNLGSRLLSLESKVKVLEKYDTDNTEFLTEMLDVVELLIERSTRQKQSTGYQPVAAISMPVVSMEMLPPPPLCFAYEYGSPPREVNCDEAWLKREDAEPPCLAKMEAAMRAMNEFLPPTGWGEFLKYDASDDDCITYRCQAEHDLGQVQKRLDNIRREEAAVVLWTDAKQTCWRQP